MALLSPSPNCSANRRTPDTIKFELVEGEVRVTEYAAEGSLYNVEMAQVSIGAGQRHPLVNELHARLT